MFFLVILTVIILFLIYRQNTKKATTNTHVEKLKNALLSYALQQVYSDKFDLNMNYASFDGSTLPHMSGSSLENGCYTYIIDKNEFRKSMFYTKHMEDKVVAIEKFLAQHIDSQDATFDFLDKFMQSCKKESD